MVQNVLFPMGIRENCRFAAGFLQRAGFLLTDHPSPDVTHILLDVPTFGADGLLQDGKDFREMLRMLPPTIHIIGGNLEKDYLADYRKTDLLKDSFFLAKNAAITAECALQVAASHMPLTFAECPTLILGWGRIGKCLASLLKQMGCPVTVAARKESDRAMLQGLGYGAVDFSEAKKLISQHRLLFNTVPAGIGLTKPYDGCVKIDLASLPGLQGCGIIAARGLPGKYAPESSGKLIADCVCREVLK